MVKIEMDENEKQLIIICIEARIYKHEKDMRDSRVSVIYDFHKTAVEDYKNLLHKIKCARQGE